LNVEQGTTIAVVAIYGQAVSMRALNFNPTKKGLLNSESVKHVLTHPHLLSRSERTSGK
jgi:hypothetical protein